MAGRYVDEDGNEITVHQWIALHKGAAIGAVLADSTVPTPNGDRQIKTLWLGTDWPEFGARAFGTVQAPAGSQQWTECEQYDTKADALRGHFRWCWRLHGVQSVEAPAECPECKLDLLLTWTPGKLDAVLDCDGRYTNPPTCDWQQIIDVEEGITRLDVVTVLHEGVDG